MASLLEGQAAAGRRVGMILDLSNHATLYRQDLTDGLGYEHVQARRSAPWGCSLGRCGPSAAVEPLPLSRVARVVPAAAQAGTNSLLLCCEATHLALP